MCIVEPLVPVPSFWGLRLNLKGINCQILIILAELIEAGGEALSFEITDISNREE
jgi:hypothetical protein